jgi:cell wall-associated NlpC family hydrolase
VEVPLPDLRSALLVAACATALVGCGQDRGKSETQPGDAVLTPQAAAQARELGAKGDSGDQSGGRLVQLKGVGAKRRLDPSSIDDAPSPGAPSDAEVRQELRAARKALASFRAYLDTTAFLPTGPRARVLGDGTAMAPDDAPEVVKRVIMAGNAIAKFPYKWGGGHGAWRDNGYDCSGSVSFALYAGGLIGGPEVAAGLMHWGKPGKGKWITVYANAGHTYMEVAGIRFDTSGAKVTGSRWQNELRTNVGFVARHPAGL